MWWENRRVGFLEEKTLKNAIKLRKSNKHLIFKYTISMMQSGIKFFSLKK